jgi:predicted MFS family arabinose efflux permease
MSQEDWICVVAIILGVFLFLYGANYYNSIVGWLGVFLFVGGISALVVLYVYHTLAKPNAPVSPQNP